LLAMIVGVAVCATTTELEPTNIEIILDASNSMVETVPGGVKINVARKAIEQLLEILPASYNVGLHAYGHLFSHMDLAGGQGRVSPGKCLYKQSKKSSTSNAK